MLNQEHMAEFDERRARLWASFDMKEYHGIPTHLRSGLVSWVLYGIRGGDFLDACIQNDLHKAMAHADTDSRRALPDIVTWLYNRAPAGAVVTRGSDPSKIEKWQGKGLLALLTDPR